MLRPPPFSPSFHPSPSPSPLPSPLSSQIFLSLSSLSSSSLSNTSFPGPLPLLHPYPSRSPSPCRHFSSSPSSLSPLSPFIHGTHRYIHMHQIPSKIKSLRKVFSPSPSLSPFVPQGNPIGIPLSMRIPQPMEMEINFFNFSFSSDAKDKSKTIGAQTAASHSSSLSPSATHSPSPSPSPSLSSVPSPSSAPSPSPSPSLFPSPSPTVHSPHTNPSPHNKDKHHGNQSQSHQAPSRDNSPSSSVPSSSSSSPDVSPSPFPSFSSDISHPPPHQLSPLYLSILLSQQQRLRDSHENQMRNLDILRMEKQNKMSIGENQKKNPKIQNEKKEKQNATEGEKRTKNTDSPPSSSPSPRDLHYLSEVRERQRVSKIFESEMEINEKKEQKQREIENQKEMKREKERQWEKEKMEREREQKAKENETKEREEEEKKKKEKEKEIQMEMEREKKKAKENEIQRQKAKEMSIQMESQREKERELAFEKENQRQKDTENNKLSSHPLPFPLTPPNPPPSASTPTPTFTPTPSTASLPSIASVSPIVSHPFPLPLSDSELAVLSESHYSSPPNSFLLKIKKLKNLISFLLAIGIFGLMQKIQKESKMQKKTKIQRETEGEGKEEQKSTNIFNGLVIGLFPLDNEEKDKEIDNESLKEYSPSSSSSLPIDSVSLSSSLLMNPLDFHSTESAFTSTVKSNSDDPFPLPSVPSISISPDDLLFSVHCHSLRLLSSDLLCLSLLESLFSLRKIQMENYRNEKKIQRKKVQKSLLEFELWRNQIDQMENKLRIREESNEYFPLSSVFPTDDLSSINEKILFSEYILGENSSEIQWEILKQKEKQKEKIKLKNQKNEIQREIGEFKNKIHKIREKISAEWREINEREKISELYYNLLIGHHFNWIDTLNSHRHHSFLHTESLISAEINSILSSESKIQKEIISHWDKKEKFLREKRNFLVEKMGNQVAKYTKFFKSQNKISDFAFFLNEISLILMYFENILQGNKHSLTFHLDFPKQIHKGQEDKSFDFSLIDSLSQSDLILKTIFTAIPKEIFLRGEGTVTIDGIREQFAEVQKEILEIENSVQNENPMLRWGGKLIGKITNQMIIKGNPSIDTSTSPSSSLSTLHSVSFFLSRGDIYSSYSLLQTIENHKLRGKKTQKFLGEMKQILILNHSTKEIRERRKGITNAMKNTKDGDKEGEREAEK